MFTVTLDNAVAGGFNIDALLIDGSAIGGAVVSLSGSRLTVAEDGTQSDVIAIVLDSRPSSEVTVDVDRLTFTAENWNQDQVVTVAGVKDHEIDGSTTSQLVVMVDSATRHAAYSALTAQPVTVTVLDNDPEGSLDIDANQSVSALSDGILILRFMAQFTGTALTFSAVDDAGGQRTRAADIESYLQSIRQALDIDGNGSVDPLSDGILVIRAMAGFTDEPLIRGAVDTALGIRTTAIDVTVYNSRLLPPANPTSLPAAVVTPASILAPRDSPGVDTAFTIRTRPCSSSPTNRTPRRCLSQIPRTQREPSAPSPG